jgi:hypothetical protein
MLPFVQVVPDERVDNLLTPDGQQVSLPPSWHLTITDLVGAVFTVGGWDEGCEENSAMKRKGTSR